MDGPVLRPFRQTIKIRKQTTEVFLSFKPTTYVSTRVAGNQAKKATALVTFTDSSSSALFSAAPGQRTFNH